MSAGERRLLSRGIPVLFFFVVCAIALGLAILQGWRPGARGAGATDVAPRLQSAVILERSGEFVAAKEQLAPLLRNPHAPGFRAARWLMWRLSWTQAMGLPENSAHQEVGRTQLARETAILIRWGGWTAAQWVRLAHGAVALGEMPAAAAAWTAAARVDPTKAVSDLYRVALVWAANDDAARAGRICLMLAGRSHSAVQRAWLFRRGISWLEGARGAASALVAARKALRHITDWRAQRAIVARVARLAMAADRPAVAASVLAASLRNRGAP